MPLYHFIPEEETFENRLTARIGICRTAFLASAFFTYGAAKVLRPSMLDSLKKGAVLTFLIGRFDFVTEPRAVDELLKLSKQFPKNVKVYFDADYNFHFKLAVFKNTKATVVIIGSSNLTPKGLGAIGEVNLEIIGNDRVYKNALELLQDRARTAVPAEDEIEDYRKKFNRAKKYRLQRLHWGKVGQKAWKTKQKKRTFVEPVGGSFKFIWVDEREDDKTLIKNAEKEHSQSVAKGNGFPNQWLHIDDKGEARRYKEDGIYVTCNKLSRDIGFVVCTRKLKLLTEHDRLEDVIFIRYLRGHKMHFKDIARFDKAVKTIGLSNRNTVGNVVVTRLKAMLTARKRKGA